MSNIKDNKPENPPAFPDPVRSINPETSRFDPLQAGNGMTLRDYFAAKAMNAIIMSPNSYLQNRIVVNDGYIHPETVSKEAYIIADAMLAERVKTDNTI